MHKGSARSPFFLGSAVDFDFSQIGVPFAMRPGLRRLDASARQLTQLTQLTQLDQASRRHGEKLAVWQLGESRHAVPGFDAGPAMRAIAARAASDGIAFDPDRDAPELAFEEDLAVLDGDSATLPWLCVCLPSHWAPEDKVGLSFAALHAPVADNAALLAASRQLVTLATAGSCWERFVWTISPSDRYDQHPRRHPRAAWPASANPAEFANHCWLRTERQTFFPVGQGTRQAVFTIHVMLRRLPESITAAWQAKRLRDALASMSPAVLAYKNLTAAREPLLRWLDLAVQEIAR